MAPRSNHSVRIDKACVNAQGYPCSLPFNPTPTRGSHPTPLPRLLELQPWPAELHAAAMLHVIKILQGPAVTVSYCGCYPLHFIDLRLIDWGISSLNFTHISIHQDIMRTYGYEAGDPELCSAFFHQLAVECHFPGADPGFGRGGPRCSGSRGEPLEAHAFLAFRRCNHGSPVKRKTEKNTTNVDWKMLASLEFLKPNMCMHITACFRCTLKIDGAKCRAVRFLT